MLACQMVVNFLVVQCLVLSVGAFIIFDVWLFAEVRFPLVMTGNGITTATFRILPSGGKYIVSAFKKPLEEGDLLIDG